MSGSRHAEYVEALPSDWEKVRVDELGEIVGGGTPSRSNPSFWGGGIRWVTPSEITELGTKVLYETRDTITASGLAGSGARLLPEGALLITTRATIGAVAVAGAPVATNQGFRSLICNGTADANFYFHLLRYIARELSRLGSGSTFDEISRRDLGRIIVPRPALDEQCRLAAILDAADDLLSRTERTIAKLERMKEGVLVDLLTRGINGDGELRSDDEGFQSSTIGAIPRSWKILPLKSLLEDGPRNGLYKPATDIGEGRLIVGQLSFTSDDSVDFLRARRAKVADAEAEIFGLRAGDLLVTRVFATRAGVGRSILVPRVPEPAVYESNMMRLRVAKDLLLPELLFMWLKTPQARRLIEAWSFSSNQTSINQAALGALPCVRPGLKEQHAIVERMRAHDTHIARERALRRKLKLLREGLCADLLTGRVRVPGPAALAGVPA